jgi:hypothetical protein
MAAAAGAGAKLLVLVTGSAACPGLLLSVNA